MICFTGTLSADSGPRRHHRPRELSVGDGVFGEAAKLLALVVSGRFSPTD